MQVNFDLCQFPEADGSILDSDIKNTISCAFLMALFQNHLIKMMSYIKRILERFLMAKVNFL